MGTVSDGRSADVVGNGGPDRRTIGPEEIAVELRQLIRKGLPATARAAGDVLPYLRNVAARATIPNDLWSAAEAIGAMLEDVIDRLGETRLVKPAQILFGIDPASQRLTLTARRQRAAAAAEYEFDHFRKRIEPKLIESVADGVYLDLAAYARRRPRRMDAYQAFKPRVIIDREELTDEDELVARIWQHVYQLRADRIAALKHPDGPERDAILAQGDHAQVLLDDLCQQYADTYGTRYLEADSATYNLDGLSSIVVWRLGREQGEPW